MKIYSIYLTERVINIFYSKAEVNKESESSWLFKMTLEFMIYYKTDSMMTFDYHFSLKSFPIDDFV